MKRSILVSFLAALCLTAPCSAVFNTASNLVSNGTAEADWLDWHYAANATIAADSAGPGTRSFQLNPSSGIHSDMRTDFLPAQPGDVFLLQYSYKSLPGATIAPGSSYAMVRSYDAADNFIGQDMFELGLTDGQWQHFRHEASAQTGATHIDVTFILNGFGDQSSSGQFCVDDISLYRQIPPLNGGIGMPEHLYVVRKSALNEAQFVAIQTLQGLLAQTKPEIWIDQGDTTYLDDLADAHGISYTRSDSLFFYMNRFKSRVAGYLLFDLNDKPSLTAATSLAGILNAVAVDVSLQSYMQSLCYTLVMDVRGKDDKWVYDNYWPQFNHDAIIVHTDDPAQHPSANFFRDFGPAIKALSWWNPSTSQSAQVYDSLHPASPVYGWMDAAYLDELQSIRFHSDHNLYQVPCDWLLNLSTYAGLAARTEPWEYTQTVRDQTPTQEQGVHYVAFKLSDMDNILTLVSAFNFNLDHRYYGSPHRGSFMMNWGMPPSLVELAPSVVDWWYRHATPNDCFTAPTAGMGYCYPHRFSALDAKMIQLEALMEQADLQTVVISDDMWPADLTYENYKSVGSAYAGIDDVRGMFYLDVYGDYARYGGKILWFDGKPLVTCRYTLWDAGQYDGVSRNAAQLAASLNALPTDPQNPDSYSFIIVHAWSYGLDEVKATVDNLAPNVRVVSVEELTEQLYLNTQVAYWPLNGDTTDHFNNHDGVTHGNPQYRPGSAARIGSHALYFDGADTYVDCGTVPGSAEWLTTMFWMKPDTLADQTLFDKLPSSGGKGWSVQIRSNGDLRFRIGSESSHTDVPVTNACRPGAWTHVACTYNSGEANVYIDGELRATMSSIPHTVDNQTAPLFMAHPGNAATGDDFSGLLDDVAIFSRPLSAQQIQDRALTGVLPSCDPYSAADVSHDCQINMLDLAFLADCWQDTGLLQRGDLNLDLKTDILDLQAMANHWLWSSTPAFD